MSDRSERSAASTRTARHPFTSTFLILFLVDGVLGIATGAAYLSDRTLFDPEHYEDVVSPFSIALVLGALVQVTLGFSRNMRWSARLLGLYVLAYWVVPAFLALLGVLFLLAGRGGLDTPLVSEPVFSDSALGALILAIGVVQILVGIWAARDLAQGHYLPSA